MINQETRILQRNGLEYNSRGGGGMEIRHILRVLRIVFTAIVSVLGGILIFLSDFLSNLSDNVVPWSQNDIQLFGYSLFIIGVILHMIISQINDIRRENSKPVLSIHKIYTDNKKAYKGKGEDREQIGNWDFAVVSIANTPVNWESGMPAEKATAEIIYINSKGEQSNIDYARWWDKEIPLFPQQIYDIKNLKQIDIEPGHPEDLVLAFKKKKGNKIYAYYYTDHRKIDTLYKERKIGKPPIEVSIKIKGRFKPVTFNRVLDYNAEGEFVLREKEKGTKWSLRKK